jgi:cytochrome b
MPRLVQVWDAPVRLFHWLLVLLVATSFTTGKLGGSWLAWHFRSGYCILTLVLFRIVWGVVGSRTARFSDFIHGPARILSHARSLRAAGTAATPGHNPLGGLMVLLLLALLLAQATTGLFADDDAGTRAPLADKVSDSVVSLLTAIHKVNVNILLACVAVHVCAALFYFLVKKENLVRPMFTGRKLLPDESEAPVLASSRIALLIGMVAAAFVAWLVLVYSR